MDTMPTWDWSAAAGDDGAATSSTPPQETIPDEEPARQNANTDAHSQAKPGESPEGSRRRHYGPRSCRICLETEHPHFTDASTTFGRYTSSSRPQYVSDDPELGRLLSPCKCKGSQKYVHEGCLNAWRAANPAATRNYWKCPTCHFEYQIARLHWASMVSSTVTQVALTLVILVACIFLLGFVADPIMDIWLDPVGMISDTVTSVVNDVEAFEEPVPRYYYDEPETWADHFFKGFLSLGLVGFLKSVVAMSPWHLWNLRSSGMMTGTTTGTRQGTGRARTENLSMVYVMVGAFTFLMGIWKVVRALSVRVLRRVSDSVIDVGEDDDDEEVEDASAGDKKDQ